MTEPSDRPVASAVFHERKTYRRRRVIDAARIAPFLTVFLWSIPLVWPQTGEDRVSSASALIYIFAVWAGVILLTFGLSRALAKSMDPQVDDDR
ncbi:hypothetical protein MWU54_04380 [Marivita sp. S6314]|uniref:hypothetical protein n=1 Tax=Marivita sp. S6314 TaxID=2926406 RepID=UPI001FF5C4A7|nr:hypothetical protein [Marivita sp. S6314]MCK0149247.1 hypothetical protein [Marivita sp. S6314]